MQHGKPAVRSPLRRNTTRVAATVSALSAAIAAGLATVGCGGVPKMAPEDAARVGRLTEFHLDLALELHRRMPPPDRAVNTAVAPTSLSAATMMLLEGARGLTGEELRAAVRIPSAGADAEAAHVLLRFLDGFHAARDPELIDIRGLWMQLGHTFHKPFVELVQQKYRAGFSVENFRGNPNTAVVGVNRFAEHATAGRIDELLRSHQVSEKSRLLVASALTFHGRWAVPFTPTPPGAVRFLTPDRGTVRPSGLRAVGSFARADTAEAEAVELPFRSAEIGLVIVLPKRAPASPSAGAGALGRAGVAGIAAAAGDAAVPPAATGGAGPVPQSAVDLAAMEARLTAKSLGALLGALRPAKIDVVLPAFRIDHRCDFRDSFEAMGVREAFNVQRADFTGVSPDGDLYLGAIPHRATITVDEGRDPRDPPPPVLPDAAPGDAVRFAVDRPFLFVLRERTSGAVLLLGRVGDPTR